jgi:hypothetical protein
MHREEVSKMEPKRKPENRSTFIVKEQSSGRKRKYNNGVVDETNNFVIQPIL